MVAILQMTFSSAPFSRMKITVFCFIQNKLKFIPEGQIDKKLISVWVMAWCHRGNKPLPDDYIDWYMYVSTCLNNSIKWMGIILTHWAYWGWVMYMCIGKLTIIGSDNGLSPRRRQAIIWTDAGILLIQPSGTIFSEIVIKIYTFSFKKMHLKMSSAKWRPFCLGLNVLIHHKYMPWWVVGIFCWIWYQELGIGTHRNFKPTLHNNNWLALVSDLQLSDITCYIFYYKNKSG